MSASVSYYLLAFCKHFVNKRSAR